jgi:uncharacterized protein
LRRSTNRSAALAEVAGVRRFCRLYDVSVEVLDRASALLERYDHLGVRDAVHAATALEAGFTSILSTDPAFDRIDEIDKVDPTSLTS